MSTNEHNLISFAVVGCGYWGPNLIRNIVENERAKLAWVCDREPRRLNQTGRRYPTAQTTDDIDVLLQDETLDAIVIATPVATHYDFARRALAAGKHVLVEKPFTASVREAEELIELADERGRVLMVDHTFVYTGAVRKIREIVARKDLGELLYFDSVRVNLGLFQTDVNVVWDLAPHDLSIMDYVAGREPIALAATGSCHVEQGKENIAYLMLQFEDSFIAHFHFNWLSPVKVRRMMIAGSRRMVVYDDIEPTEKVRVYDTGVTTSRNGNADGEATVNGDASDETKYQTLVSYRTGDVWIPKLDPTEALRHVISEFVNSITERRAPLTDGRAGLRVVRLLEAAQQSIDAGGRLIELKSQAKADCKSAI